MMTGVRIPHHKVTWSSLLRIVVLVVTMSVVLCGLIAFTSTFKMGNVRTAHAMKLGRQETRDKNYFVLGKDPNVMLQPATPVRRMKSLHNSNKPLLSPPLHSYPLNLPNPHDNPTLPGFHTYAVGSASCSPCATVAYGTCTECTGPDAADCAAATCDDGMSHTSYLLQL